VYGFSEQRATIDVDLVQQVIADRASGGLLPLKIVGKRANDAVVA
jgi:hypothetical protein